MICCRSEIANLTEKVRALEIAQVNQRKSQAIAMAALAAEKLKSQKKSCDFQSDSNLHLMNAENNNVYSKQQKLALPMGKRLLLKVIFADIKVDTK